MRSKNISDPIISSRPEIKSGCKRAFVLFIILQGMTLISCKKFLGIPPPKNEVVTATVYNNDATVISAVRGIYSQMFSSGFASGLPSSITYLSGNSADELTNYSTDPDLIQFYTNSLISTSSGSFGIWQSAYSYISSTNDVIKGLTNSTGVTASTKSELIGEAKFVRAFCYFYLANLFSDVPLITSTNYQINEVADRMPVAQVYQQIISDLQDAQNALSNDFSYSNGERDQPNNGAATALLSRVYLYTGDWSDAQAQSTAIINNKTTYNLVPNPDSVFLSNSTEAIWQLKPNGSSNNSTNEGSIFILNSAPNNAALSNQLLNAFEPGDIRRSDWVDSVISGGITYYFPFKYKIQTASTLTEYSMVLRLAEQYLIRAEAEARLNNLPDAINDLNIIRTRAGLPNTSATTQTELLAAILHERQVELFTEWGHRWLDLKRTGLVDSVMTMVTPQKGNTWNTVQQLYPIPKSDILIDNHLTQNTGY
jgi:hypothetical protein